MDLGTDLRWKTYNEFSRYLIADNGYIHDLLCDVPVSQYPNPEGYIKVTLRRDDDKRKTLSVHRLVALCFIPNPLNLPEVNHEDGIKSNNIYTNLSWMTHAQNIQHAWNNKLLKNTESRSAKLVAANLYKQDRGKNFNASPVYCITTNESFECIEDVVEKYGIDQAQISKCCTGYRGVKSAGKHPVTGEKLIWRYL